MGENGHAPTKKGIENTVEHGTYQCLMTPTGLEEFSQTGEKPHLRVQNDAKTDATQNELAFLINRWQKLPECIRTQIMVLVSQAVER